MSELEQLYPPLVLRHDRCPSNAMPVADATAERIANNPLCGDRVALTLKLSDQRIEAIGCAVRGCALCRASGSLLTEIVLQRAVEDALVQCGRWLELLGAGAGQSPPAAPLDVLEPLLAVRAFPSRIGCVRLPWEAFRDALRLEGCSPM